MLAHSHAFLGVRKDFTNWMKTQIDRARLVLHRDYEVFAHKGVNPTGGRPRREFVLTLDFAKHTDFATTVKIYRGGEQKN